MSIPCPHCGAVLREKETCADRFDLAQFKEMADPAFGQVHYLSVPCYKLQHNAYSRPGWLAVRDLLHRFVFDGLTPEQARRSLRAGLYAGNRVWRVTKGPKLPGVEDIAWSVTVADLRLDSATDYCEDVRRWAVQLLADTESLAETVRRIRK